MDNCPLYNLDDKLGNLGPGPHLLDKQLETNNDKSSQNFLREIRQKQDYGSIAQVLE